MGSLFSPGPVFAYEWLTRSRRWQSFASRSLFVLALLVGLGVVWQAARFGNNLTTRQQLVQAGQSFFVTMTIIEISMILLAAPAATAGSICLDKARGTLAHVLVTDLTDREVVLGKFAARLVPVLNLVACALPVAALGSLMGGIDPVGLTASFLVVVGLAVLGCSLALALSVWMSKAHEVMFAVFGVWLVWLTLLPIWEICRSSFGAVPAWVEVSNPYWLALSSNHAPARFSVWHPVVFFGVCLTLSALLAMLSVSRVRRVYLRQVNRVPKAVKKSRSAAWFRGKVRWWPGPSLDKNPVLWREWHRNRPSKAIRIIWGLYATLATGLSLYMIGVLLVEKPNGPRSELPSVYSAFQACIGLLFLSVSAGTVLSEERVRGSLDVLLSTPLSTRSIVWGKWWGSYRNVPWLAYWPALIGFAALPNRTSAPITILAFLIPIMVLIQGAALVSLGLALATWISRTGVAVTLSIAALVASVVGWPVLDSLLGGPGPRDQVLSMGSAFFNVGFTTAVIEAEKRGGSMGGVNIPTFWMVLCVWGAIYATLAISLYLATLATFERCLGRTSERGNRPAKLALSKAGVGKLDQREVDRGLVP